MGIFFNSIKGCVCVCVCVCLCGGAERENENRVIGLKRTIDIIREIRQISH